MIGVQTPGGGKEVATFSILTADGAKDIARGSILTADGSKDFFVSGGGAGLTLEAMPITATGSGGSGSTITVTTNSISVNVSGGTGPFTYAWTEVGVSTADWTILSPSASSTRFSAPVETASFESANFRCTVTDARGRTGTIDVPATVYNFGSFGSF